MRKFFLFRVQGLTLVILCSFPVCSLAASTLGGVGISLGGACTSSGDTVFDDSPSHILVCNGATWQAWSPGGGGSATLDDVLTEGNISTQDMQSGNHTIKDGTDTTSLVFLPNSNNAGEHKIGFSFHGSNSIPVAIVGSAAGAFGRGSLAIWVDSTIGDGSSADSGDQVASFHSDYVGIHKPLYYTGRVLNLAGNNNDDLKLEFSHLEKRIAIVSKANGFGGYGDLRFVMNSTTDADQAYDAITDTKLLIGANGNIGVGPNAPQSSFHVPDGKYLQAEDNNAGAPASGDCDANAERGRLSIDTSNNRLYVCNGATRGWDYVALTD